MGQHINRKRKSGLRLINDQGLRKMDENYFHEFVGKNQKKVGEKQKRATHLVKVNQKDCRK